MVGDAGGSQNTTIWEKGGHCSCAISFLVAGSLCTGYHLYSWVTECLLPQTRIVHHLLISLPGWEALVAQSSCRTELGCPHSSCHSEMGAELSWLSSRDDAFPMRLSEIQLEDATLPGVESAHHNWMTGGHSSS